jgi:hypothetical protein
MCAKKRFLSEVAEKDSTLDPSISESEKKVHQDQNRTEWGMTNQSSTCGGILEAQKKKRNHNNSNNNNHTDCGRILWVINRDNLLVRWTLLICSKQSPPHDHELFITQYCSLSTRLV